MARISIHEGFKTDVQWHIYDIRRQRCCDMHVSNWNILAYICNPMVNHALRAGFMRNLEVGLPKHLEEGLKVLIYAWAYDFVCNWLGHILSSRAFRCIKKIMCFLIRFEVHFVFEYTGNFRWVMAMKWSGQLDFVLCPFQSSQERSWSTKESRPCRSLSLRSVCVSKYYMHRLVVNELY